MRIRVPNGIIALVIAGTVVHCTGAEGKAPSIRCHSPGPGKQARFEVTGLDRAVLNRILQANFSRDQWTALFAVYVGGNIEGQGQTSLPLLGTHLVRDGLLVFEP